MEKHIFSKLEKEKREKSLDEGQSDITNGSLQIFSPEGGSALDFCQLDTHRDATKEVTSLKRV